MRHVLEVTTVYFDEDPIRSESSVNLPTTNPLNELSGVTDMDFDERCAKRMLSDILALAEKDNKATILDINALASKLSLQCKIPRSLARPYMLFILGKMIDSKDVSDKYIERIIM